ncbi:MAG: bifunctional nuclease family protein [Phycisphaerales bacterium]
MLIPVHLSRIFIREMADMQIIELTETGGQRRFPIVIGLPEAFAIDRRIKGVQIPRPQTHDLLANVVRAMGGTLQEIRITHVDGGTFYAQLVIQLNGGEVLVDSRPSDAIALGVADNVPILVEEDVLEQASAEAAAGTEGTPDIQLDDEDEDDA